jgi:hypothetical protein
VVVIFNPAGATVRLRFAEDFAPVESVTVAVTVNVPSAVGVPVIAPAPEIDKPPGSPVAENV